MRKTLLLLGVLLPLSGCLDYEEILTLAADGSGSVKVDFTVDLAFEAKLKALMKSPEPEATPGAPDDVDDPYKMMVSKQEVLKYVQGVDGVTVKECTAEEPSPGKHHVKLLVEFKSLDALRKTNAFRDGARELTFTAKDDKVEAVYKVDAKILGSLLPGPAGEDEQEKKARKIVDEATLDAGAHFTVVFPAKPLSTTGKADEKEDKAAVWTVPKKDEKAHAALAKDPIVMKAELAKKDAAKFLAPEKKKDDK
ncbi:MAG TPA: hypothetical protein VFF73_21770 [Planctomycetota bacterium]|nr:hypothetical protein [Planctomycetota bacterium]